MNRSGPFGAALAAASAIVWMISAAAAHASPPPPHSCHVAGGNVRATYAVSCEFADQIVKQFKQLDGYQQRPVQRFDAFSAVTGKTYPVVCRTVYSQQGGPNVVDGGHDATTCTIMDARGDARISFYSGGAVRAVPDHVRCQPSGLDRRYGVTELIDVTSKSDTVMREIADARAAVCDVARVVAGAEAAYMIHHGGRPGVQVSRPFKILPDGSHAFFGGAWRIVPVEDRDGGEIFIAEPVYGNRYDHRLRVVFAVDNWVAGR